MKRTKILSLLLMLGFLAVGGTFTVKAQKLSNKFKVWEISEGRSGGRTGRIESSSIGSDGNLIKREGSLKTTKKIDEPDLREIVKLLTELKLPGTKTRIVKGKRIYDGVYGWFTITLDGKDYKLEGSSFYDEKQVALTAAQKKTLDKLKSKLAEIRRIVSSTEINPLANTNWLVESYGTRDNRQQIVANMKTNEGDPATGFEALIEFSDSKFGGRIAGCNILGYDYTVKDSTIKTKSVSTTVMACSDKIMKQESEIHKALETVHSFRLDGEQLEIFYDTDKVILLRQFKPTAPLKPTK